MTPAPVYITDKILTTGEIEITTDFEEVGEDYLKIKVDERYHKDPCTDDRALIIKTDDGLVVVLGCAHRCLINTLNHARTITGEDRIHMVVGGCHLIDASDKVIEQTIDALKPLNINKIGVSHCTGLHAGAKMASEFGDRFFFNTAGTTVTVE